MADQKMGSDKKPTANSNSMALLLDFVKNSFHEKLSWEGEDSNI